MRTMMSAHSGWVPRECADRDLEFRVREVPQGDRAKLFFRQADGFDGCGSQKGRTARCITVRPTATGIVLGLIQLSSCFRLCFLSLVTSGRCATRCRFAASSYSAKRHRSVYKDTRPEWRERKHAGSALHPPRRPRSSQKRCLTPSPDLWRRQRIVRRRKEPGRTETPVRVKSENTLSARTNSSARAPSRPKADP